jgi:hypothetical protein
MRLCSHSLDLGLGAAHVEDCADAVRGKYGEVRIRCCSVNIRINEGWEERAASPVNHSVDAGEIPGSRLDADNVARAGTESDISRSVNLAAVEDGDVGDGVNGHGWYRDRLAAGSSSAK